MRNLHLNPNYMILALTLYYVKHTLGFLAYAFLKLNYWRKAMDDMLRTEIRTSKIVVSKNQTSRLKTKTFVKHFNYNFFNYTYLNLLIWLYRSFM